MKTEQKKKISTYTKKESEDLKKMIYTTLICILFIIAELVGGILANSLAIISDAAHLFSDLSGFFISIIAMIIGKKTSNSKYTFGYYRAEVIGALISVITIWILTGFLLKESYDRLINPSVIDAKIMLITAIVGLICNLSMISVLHSSGHAHGGQGCNHNHSNTNNNTKLNHNNLPKSNSSSGDGILDQSNINLIKFNKIDEKDEVEDKLE